MSEYLTFANISVCIYCKDCSDLKQIFLYPLIFNKEKITLLVD